jgi:hypothetical protein
MSEAPGSQFPIQQPQPADHLEIKLREPITIRRGLLLLSCLGVTAANRYRSAALDAKGTPYLRPRTLDVRPYIISVVKSFGG